MSRPSDLEHPDTASADQTSADDARRRLREQGIVAVEPDARIGVMLGPGERVVAVRREVSLERRKLQRDPDEMLSGDLYVTTRRLVYLGSVPVAYDLSEVREAVVATGALRLVVGESHGVEIGVPDPRLLRVELAAAREAERASAAGSDPGPVPPDAGESPRLPEPPA